MKAGARAIKESTQYKGKEFERLKMPPSNIKAKAIVNAPVASIRCLNSVLEKCQMDPLCSGIVSMMSGSSNQDEVKFSPRFI
tara:strand:- start:263 stop:508 length:246 start_codon:yes stop_codon:yes gene_type:complete